MSRHRTTNSQTLIILHHLLKWDLILSTTPQATKVQFRPRTMVILGKNSFTQSMEGLCTMKEISHPKIFTISQ